jgi:hypothetical protein
MTSIFFFEKQLSLKVGYLKKNIFNNFQVLHTVSIVVRNRVKRNWNMQKSTRAVVQTLIRNNFYPTTFQNFECEWPRLGLKDRKNGQKLKFFFRILEIFSKVEVQKLNICACLSHLIKFDEKKITLDILCWEFWLGHLIEIDHFWIKKSFFKNRHSTFKWPYLIFLNR